MNNVRDKKTILQTADVVSDYWKMKKSYINGRSR